MSDRPDVDALEHLAAQAASWPNVWQFHADKIRNAVPALLAYARQVETRLAAVERERDEAHRVAGFAEKRAAAAESEQHDRAYTVGDALGLRRLDEDDTFARPIIARSMRTLAANLAVGGALCAAFDIGRAWMDDWEPADHSDRWRPGCGRAWGGGA